MAKPSRKLASTVGVGLLAMGATLGTATTSSAAPSPRPVSVQAGDVQPYAAGTYYATTWASVANRTCASTNCASRGTLAANTTYVINCWVYGQTVTAEGYTNNVWLQVRWTDWSVGYSSAIYFKGDKYGNLPLSAQC